MELLRYLCTVCKEFLEFQMGSTWGRQSCHNIVCIVPDIQYANLTLAERGGTAKIGGLA